MGAAGAERGGSGPLSDVKVLEIAGVAPGPFAGCMLADMGADVVVLDRIGGRRGPNSPLLDRGKRSLAVDLKHPGAARLVLDLAAGADVLIEGMRPGVAERLGFGPDRALSRNPGLVYGRMTGYGQDGPMAPRAGHDINYISLSGALGRIGRAGQPPTPPLSLVGDFGGGGLMLAFGLLAALHEVRRSGRGQVVDAAMVEGSAMLMLPFFGGSAGTERGHGLIDSGAPFYDSYPTADGGWLALGAIEPQFYAALLQGLGLDGADLPEQMDSSGWPRLREEFARVIAGRTRDGWVAHFEGTDACVTPVLDLEEVDRHPHNAARSAHIEVGGVLQPAPAPRLSATPASVRRPPPAPGGDCEAVLGDWLAATAAQISGWREERLIG